MKRAEMETVIVFNEKEQECTVETFSVRLINKIDRICASGRDGFEVIEKKTVQGRAYRVYWVPKRYVSIRTPRADIAGEREEEYMEEEEYEEEEEEDE